MSKIEKVLHVDNRGDSAQISVLLQDGTEAVVWVGGEVEVYFDHRYNKVKAWVKRPSSIDK